MPLVSVHSVVRKTRIMAVRYVHVLLVLAAFTVMVIASYLFVSDMERKHLRRNVEEAISYTDLNIKLDLLEPETILGGVSETIRDMILRGDSRERILEYIIYIDNYVQSDTHANSDRMIGVIGFYGFFDVFNDEFFTSADDWEPPEEYDPRLRPWYIAAEEAAGEAGVTQPYIDEYSKDTIITFSRRIFDDEGNPLGTVCLDMRLDRVRQHAVHVQFAEHGYGFLISKDLTVIAHPEPSLLGLTMFEVKSSISDFAMVVWHKNYISEVITTDYRGVKSILFIKKLHNDWYMGVVTPKNTYYHSTRILGIILTLLGGALAVILSAVLLRVVAEKQKSDERSQVMFDTTIEKIREADVSKKTIYTLEHILNGLDELIYVTDPQSDKILFINDYMKKHYNIKDELIGQICYKVLQQGINDRCPFCPCYQLDKEPEKVIEWVEHNTLTKRIYRNNDLYFEWSDGRMAHLQHSVDITELEAAKEQAIQASTSKTNFLARMSHEIRTPMNAILGITEIQLQEETLPEAAREALGRIYNSGDLLLGIINDVLDFSKIEAGKLELASIKYETASLIHDIVQLNLIRYESKPIDFNLQIDETVPVELIGDELRIKQILNNLLSNAFKYTHEGAVSLDISVEPSEQPDAVTLVFCVSDTGQGMTPEQVSQLGDMYSRFNSEVNRTTEGTGLGMSITLSLIQQMNGEIAIESSANKGSSFTVRLPQGTAALSGVIGKDLAEKLGEFSLNSLSQMKKTQVMREFMPYGRILVVDDVETNLYVARGLLAPYGLSIDTAQSGFDAIEKIRAGSVYDIIFMDHMMPKMDGIETAQIIRSMGYEHPIVALTANALTGQAEMFMKNGFDGFISKPIDVRQLNASLNKLVRDKHPSEVIDAARQQKISLYTAEDDLPATGINPRLAEIFIRDAKKAISVLEPIYKNRCRRADDKQMVIINVHAMKSALENIGEPGLSATAFKLEQAGREQNVALILSDMPAFLDALRGIIVKISPEEDNESSEIMDENADDVRSFLHDKLFYIQMAATAFDKKTAKETLAELRQKRWLRPTKELLNTLASHLLHSEFEETANAVRDYLQRF